MTLFVVGTPIGNLGDLTLRAAETLRTVPVVFAEDTRVTRRLLAAAGSSARLVRLDANATPDTIGKAIGLLADQDAAVVTDAGTPGVSDPVRALVEASIAKGISVSPIPGPSAVTAIVSVSPLVHGPFLFSGFPPARGTPRQTWIAEALASPVPVVVFEAPGRVTALLEAIAALDPDRPVTIGRELTKLHEEIWTGPAREARDRLVPRGEFSIVIGPGAGPVAPTLEDLRPEAERLLRTAPQSRVARDLAARTGLPRSIVYQWLGQFSPGDEG